MMNKTLTLFLTFLLLFTTYNLQAQGRKIRFVNLKVELDRFNEGDTFYTPGTIFSRMYIINNGPDSVFRGDMLHIEYKFGGFYYNPTFPSSPKSFGKGDTLIFAKYISTNGYQNSFNRPFCGFSRLVKVYNGDSLVYETPQQEKDNWSCMNANHIALLSVKQTTRNSLSIYPNPSTGILYLSGQKSSLLYVFTPDGRKLTVQHSGNVSGNDELEFDIRFLPAGVYFLEYEGKTCKLIKY